MYTTGSVMYLLLVVALACTGSVCGKSESDPDIDHPLLANGTRLGDVNPKGLLGEYCRNSSASLGVSYDECLDIYDDFYPRANIRSGALNTSKLFVDFYQGDSVTPKLSGSYEEVSSQLSRFKPKSGGLLILLAHGLNSGPWSMDDVRHNLGLQGNDMLLNINYNAYVNSTLHYLSFVHKVGEHCRIIIDKLIKPLRNNDTEVGLMGHSLGGQTVGVLGNLMSSAEFNMQPKYVIGLDAAGPIFTMLAPQYRLNAQSGHRVLSIHTSIVLGIYQRNGLVDFYVNDVTRNYKECGDNFDPEFVCNHQAALKVWKELYDAYRPGDKPGDKVYELHKSDGGNEYNLKLETGIPALLRLAEPGVYRSSYVKGSNGNTMKLIPLKQ